jgi:hypothetical protein
MHLMCDVLQGSILGPISLVLHTADLVRLVERHSLQVHLYAADTQVFGSSPPYVVNVLQARPSNDLSGRRGVRDAMKSAAAQHRQD